MPSGRLPGKFRQTLDQIRLQFPTRNSSLNFNMSESRTVFGVRIMSMESSSSMIRSKTPSRLPAQPGFERATSMAFLWALLALVLHVLPGVVGPVHAQGTRKDDVVFNSRGVPLAGATVRVCAQPATGQP